MFLNHDNPVLEHSQRVSYYRRGVILRASKDRCAREGNLGGYGCQIGESWKIWVSERCTLEDMGVRERNLGGYGCQGGEFGGYG